MEHQRKYIEGILSEKYGDYIKQNVEKYKQFLFSKMETNPQNAREIHEVLTKGESKIPPAWGEFLGKCSTIFFNFY